MHFQSIPLNADGRRCEKTRKNIQGSSGVAEKIKSTSQNAEIRNDQKAAGVRSLCISALTGLVQGQKATGLRTFIGEIPEHLRRYEKV